MIFSISPRPTPGHSAGAKQTCIDHHHQPRLASTYLPGEVSTWTKDNVAASIQAFKGKQLHKWR